MVNYFVHSSSYVDTGAQIGAGTKIWHFCHIMKAQIGMNCTIGQGCFIGENVIIGNNVKIQNGVNIFDGVIIEDDVFIAPSVTFTNVKRPNAFVKQRYEATIIRRGAIIGANSTIICVNEIGEGALVGAGSVVTRDVRANGVYYGVPARRRDKGNDNSRRRRQMIDLEARKSIQELEEIIVKLGKEIDNLRDEFLVEMVRNIQYFIERAKPKGKE